MRRTTFVLLVAATTIAADFAIADERLNSLGVGDSVRVSLTAEFSRAIGLGRAPSKWRYGAIDSLGDSGLALLTRSDERLTIPYTEAVRLQRQNAGHARSRDRSEGILAGALVGLGVGRLIEGAVETSRPDTKVTDTFWSEGQYDRAGGCPRGAQCTETVRLDAVDYFLLFSGCFFCIEGEEGWRVRRTEKVEKLDYTAAYLASAALGAVMGGVFWGPREGWVDIALPDDAIPAEDQYVQGYRLNTHELVGGITGAVTGGVIGHALASDSGLSFWLGLAGGIGGGAIAGRLREEEPSVVAAVAPGPVPRVQLVWRF